MPFEQREREIEERKSNRSFVRRLLPEALEHVFFEDLEAWEASIRERRAETRDAFERFRDAAREAIDTAESRWEQFESGGDGDAAGDLADLESRLAAVAAGPGDNAELPGFDHSPEQYLRQEELAELDDLRERAATYAERVQAKRVFDDAVGDLAVAFRDMDPSPHELSNCERYLTRAEFDRFRRQFEPVERAIADVREAGPDRLPRQDRERFEEFAATADALRPLATTENARERYNAAFIDRERDRYGHLVTDLGDGDVDLTDEQCRAVFQNAEYNQVIAGAGTGKTLSLTCRIAYLIEKGVDPEDIAALTFTNKAVDTMRDRLRSFFGITSVDVRTINSFGREIIDEFGSLPRDTIDGPENFIERHTTSGFADLPDAFAHHYRQYLSAKSADYVDESEFDDREELVRERRERRYETLKGEEVKSVDEKVIADFLFEHGVTYRYEAEAAWADTGRGERVYEPDFYLPEHDIYIEHWGIDERGEVASFFQAEGADEEQSGSEDETDAAATGTDGADRDAAGGPAPEPALDWEDVDPASRDYCETLLLKRRAFKDSEYDLIDTYHFEQRAGRLREALESRLRARDVGLELLGPEELHERVVDAAEEYELVQEFTRFVQTARRYRLESDDVLARLDESNPAQYHFGRCGAILLEAYRTHLREENRIDYLGMILQAVPLVRDNHELKAEFEHVLVDEFQDISPPQAGLFDALSEGPDGPTLFAVGDDWQSIYGFRGGEPRFFIDFEAQFGPPDVTKQTLNFRSAPAIVKAGNAVISHNDRQIDKEVRAAKDVKTEPRLHVLGGDDDSYVDATGVRAAVQAYDWLFTGSEEGVRSPEDVMILCRYDTGSDHIEKTKEYLRRLNLPYRGYTDSGREDVYAPRKGVFADADPEDAISIYSIHRAKGEEAECVILLHVATNGQAFPADEQETDLLDPVDDAAIDTIAEERRLFYVGVTRAESELHVLTKAESRSPFVEEIDDHLATHLTVSGLRVRAADFDEGDSERVTVRVRVQTLYDDIHEKMAQKGLVEDETGSIAFLTWADAPAAHVDEGRYYRLVDAKLECFRGWSRLVIDQQTEVRIAQTRPGQQRFLD